MKSDVVTTRYFPTFDFVVRTDLVREDAIRALTTAMTEESLGSWPLPKAQLKGVVDGGTFTCQPRTSVLGGNAVPSVSGQIIPRSDGGTDIVVRVVEWFSFLLGLPLLALSICFGVKAGSATERLESAGMSAWLMLILSAMYIGQVLFVRGIFKRLFQAP
jgi:hypothetical protein